MWHLKNGIQKAIEIITAGSMLMLLGASDIDFSNKLSWVVLSILLFNTFVGSSLLIRFGKY